SFSTAETQFSSQFLRQSGPQRGKSATGHTGYRCATRPSWRQHRHAPARNFTVISHPAAILLGMAWKSTLASVMRPLGRFGRDSRANIAVTFSLATLPIIGVVGAAVDFSHANSVKVALQAALDSTALVLAKNASTMTDSELQSQARSYFAALF